MRIQGLRVVSLAFLLGMAVTAAAAPLDLQHVSADATWLGHVDFDTVYPAEFERRIVEFFDTYLSGN